MDHTRVTINDVDDLSKEFILASLAPNEEIQLIYYMTENSLFGLLKTDFYITVFTNKRGLMFHRNKSYVMLDKSVDWRFSTGVNASQGFVCLEGIRDQVCVTVNDAKARQQALKEITTLRALYLEQ